MSCTAKPLIDYDSNFDVMSYVFGDTSNSYGDEDLGNIVVLKDMDTDNVTGYTIMNFRRICENKDKDFNYLSKLFDINYVMSECGFK